MRTVNKNEYRIILNTIGSFLLLLGLIVFEFTYVPLIYSYINYQVNKNNQNKEIEVKVEEQKEESRNIEPVVPVDENFTIIIPKIEVNAPVVEGVSTANAIEYSQALRNGVAHAKGTALPGQEGNMFIFAHSSLNFWQLGKYATVFNLIKQLEPGDTVTFYYKNEPYLYSVIDKTTVPGWNTAPFEQEYTEPIATLITCDPPGTTLNRMVIRAKLVRM
jgi:LPXTG-site transpeptidase (sortase) family protein